MKRRPTLDQLKAQCIVWNHEHPVGTAVVYHSVIGEKAGVLTKTRYEAYVLSGHTAVTFVEGVRGCVCLDALSLATEGTVCV